MDQRQQAVRETMLDIANEPFEFGRVDCCLFAASVARRITGTDYGAAFDHTDEAGAQRYIDDAGGLEQLITKTLGCEPTEALESLRDGDPVLVDVVGEQMIGVLAAGVAIIKTSAGTLRVYPKRILKGWKLDNA